MDAQPALPSQRLQFVDFAKWQQQNDTQAALNQHLKFWESELGGVSLPILELPEDKLRPPTQSFKVKLPRFPAVNHCRVVFRVRD